MFIAFKKITFIPTGRFYLSHIWHISNLHGENKENKTETTISAIMYFPRYKSRNSRELQCTVTVLVRHYTWILRILSFLSCQFLPLKFSDVLSISPQKDNGPLCKFNFCSVFKRKKQAFKNHRKLLLNI